MPPLKFTFSNCPVLHAFSFIILFSNFLLMSVMRHFVYKSVGYAILVMRQKIKYSWISNNIPWNAANQRDT